MSYYNFLIEKNVNIAYLLQIKIYIKKLGVKLLFFNNLKNYISFAK